MSAAPYRTIAVPTSELFVELGVAILERIAFLERAIIDHPGQSTFQDSLLLIKAVDALWKNAAYRTDLS